jgi:hypothetical protein
MHLWPPLSAQAAWRADSCGCGAQGPQLHSHPHVHSPLLGLFLAEWLVRDTRGTWNSCSSLQRGLNTVGTDSSSHGRAEAAAGCLDQVLLR